MTLNNLTLIDIISECWPDPSDTILGYLSPKDLNNLSQVDHSRRDSPMIKRIWEKAEKNLDYSPNPEKSSAENFYVFAKDLVSRIEKYPEEQVPQDIRELFKPTEKMTSSIEEVCKLQKFIKARDTLIVWRKLAERAGITLDFPEEFKSAKATIEFARGFTDWMNKDENKASLQSISNLDLSDKKLIFIPQQLGNLDLKSLNLSHNQLISIPKTLGNLKNLEVLDLSANELTSIPKELGNLTNLISLYLNNNQFTSIPEALQTLKKLTTLGLSKNQLTAISSVLESMTSLTSLYLNGNQLTSISSELGSLTNLETLGLSENQITAISPVLGTLTNLVNLDLRKNQLTSVSPELGTLTNLIHLDLRDNQLTSISPVLRTLTNLIHLDLRGNPLTLISAVMGSFENPGVYKLDNLSLRLKQTLISAPLSRMNRITGVVVSNIFQCCM